MDHILISLPGNTNHQQLPHACEWILHNILNRWGEIYNCYQAMDLQATGSIELNVWQYYAFTLDSSNETNFFISTYDLLNKPPPTTQIRSLD